MAPRSTMLTPPMVTNSGKLLFPDDGITKGDLVAYYRSVADRMLPYLEDRPLMLERYPDGLNGSHFFEKDAPRGAPSWLTTVAIYSKSAKRTIHYVVCNDERSLLYLANLATITFHAWQSRVSDLAHPDVLLFDLDPTPACPLRRLARVAVGVRDALAVLDLEARVKATGGKGLHVIIPLRGDSTYAAIRRFAGTLAKHIVEMFPDDVTLERAIARRPRGSLLFDYAQIAQGKTFAVPFTVRARPGAPVSMPLDWAQVEAWTTSRITDPHKAFSQWCMANAADERDLWGGSYGTPQRLEPALERSKHEWR